MMTVKASNSSNGNGVEKFLLNRSRSRSQIMLKYNLSPIKPYLLLCNSVVIKASHNDKIQIQNWSPNAEYYQLQEQPLRKKIQKNQNNKKKFILQNKRFQKQFIVKQTKDNCKLQYNVQAKQYSAIQFMKKVNQKNIPQANYKANYLSPSIRLRQLQKQKKLEKRKAIENLQKVVKMQEMIRLNRIKNKLQAQLFSQLVSKLKKSNLFDILNVPTYQKFTSIISKTQGSLNTFQGESSKQL